MRESTKKSLNHRMVINILPLNLGKCCQGICNTVRLNLNSREEEGIIQWKYFPTMRVSLESLVQFAFKGVNQKMEAMKTLQLKRHDVNSSHLCREVIPKSYHSIPKFTLRDAHLVEMKILIQEPQCFV